MSIKNLFKNIGLLVVLNLLVKPIWLFTDLVVQDRISHENYGIYAALFSLSFLFINLADFGVNVYVVRKLAADRGSLNDLFSNAFTFKILACIFYPVFITAIGFSIGYRGDMLKYLFILGLVQSLLQTLAFFRSNFQARQLFQVDAFTSVADKIILLVIVLVLLYTGYITLSTFIDSFLIASFFTCLLSFIVLVKIQGWIRPSFSMAGMKGVLVQSFPFAMIGILFAINERVDMVMIERLGGIQGKQNAGLYAAAYRWLDAIMMYLWTILPFFFAKFAAHSKQPEEQQKIFNFGQLLTFIPMLYASVFVFFYGDKLFWMFKHSTSSELDLMTTIIKILFIGTFVQGAFTIYGTYLNSTGHEKQVSYMIVVSLLLNVILNWIFIPKYGPVASACATVISTLVMCVYYLIRVSRKSPLKIPLDLLLKQFVISVSFGIIFYLLSLTTLAWYINSTIAGLFLVGLTYITDTGNIKSIIKGKS